MPKRQNAKDRKDKHEKAGSFDNRQIKGTNKNALRVLMILTIVLSDNLAAIKEKWIISQN
jgi:hypothetical protein